MTDKEKIIAYIDKLLEKYPKNYYLLMVAEFINSLQKEPVSIWHDSNEEQPNYASTVAIWSPKSKNGEIISRCTEVYSDRIWAYIDDLLKM